MTSNASKIAATITPEQVTEGFSSSTTKSTTPPQIQIFNSSLHPEFGNLRTLTIEGEPWFVGRDVAEALGYFNTSKAIRNHVSEDDLKTLKYKAYNVSGEASFGREMIILINLSSTNPVSTLSSSAASSKKPKSLSTGLQQKFFLLFARPGDILTLDRKISLWKRTCRLLTKM